MSTESDCVRYAYGIMFIPTGEVTYISENESRVRALYDNGTNKHLFGLVAYEMLDYYPINNNNAEETAPNESEAMQ